MTYHRQQEAAMLDTPTISQLINVDPEIMSGTPVFMGTRVPIKNLWDYLERGHGLDDFLDGFPSVSRAQAVAVLVAARGSLLNHREHAALAPTPHRIDEGIVRR